MEETEQERPFDYDVSDELIASYNESVAMTNDLSNVSPDTAMLIDILNDFMSGVLVEEINGLEFDKDPDISEDQMRDMVIRLQTVAFIAGAMWADVRKPPEMEGENIKLRMSSDEKLALVKALLNDQGINLSIL